jgi:predicted anti-sigma-YlaC factor YlaD
MKLLGALLVLTLLGVNTGCGVKKFAINKLGDSLAQSGTTFTSDDDPDLVGQALPFGLKLYESLLAESPRHRGLLLAASQGFTSYAYAFVQQDADEMEDADLTKATAMRGRARRLYLRARDYGVRGLEAKHSDFGKSLRSEPKAAVRVASKADVPLLYWTASSWGLAISVSKSNTELIADQPIVEALIDRALELQENFDVGAIHSFLISYELSRPGGTGDPAARARKHFDSAMVLSGGFQAGPLVSLAESVSIEKQNRKEFQELLNRALQIDVNAKPEFRLINLVMQRRARWLLGRIDQLFVN